jgi:glucose-6-phosphate isomerase
MRQAISLKGISIPRYEEGLTSEGRDRIASHMKEWDESNFAGYRRLIEEGSDCYPDLKAIKALAEKSRTGSTGKPIQDFVLLGTGGSSLGGETILRCLRPSQSAPRFHFMDNNDPQWFSWLVDSLDPETTLVYVVSKSGKTPETISQFLVLLEWSKRRLGTDWKKHFVFCTDPKSGDLRALVKQWDLPCLEVPSPVGGRFSVFSPVGLFPAAFAGLNISAFLEGARSVLAWENQPTEQNPCFSLARALALGAKERPITVLMPYSTQLSAFSRWFCQLWAESLGKDGQGLTPYPAVGTTDQHSQMQLYMEGPRDKVVVLVHLNKFSQALKLTMPEGLDEMPSFMELKNRSMLELFDAEFNATRDALTANKVPNATIEVDQLDEYSLGALFFFWERATAVAGAVIGVNPFDQPGVEAAKILTKKYLAAGAKK